MDLRRRSLRRRQRGGVRLGDMGKGTAGARLDANIAREYGVLKTTIERLAATVGKKVLSQRERQRRGQWKRRLSATYGKLRGLLMQRRQLQVLRDDGAVDSKLPSTKDPAALRKDIRGLASKVARAVSKGQAAEGAAPPSGKARLRTAQQRVRKGVRGARGFAGRKKKKKSKRAKKKEEDEPSIEALEREVGPLPSGAEAIAASQREATAGAQRQLEELAAQQKEDKVERQRLAAQLKEQMQEQAQLARESAAAEAADTPTKSTAKARPGTSVLQSVSTEGLGAAAEPGVELRLRKPATRKKKKKKKKKKKRKKTRRKRRPAVAPIEGITDPHAATAEEAAARARKVESLEGRIGALEESLLKARQAEEAAKQRVAEAKLAAKKAVDTKDEEIAALKAKEKKTAAWRGFAEKVGAKQARENRERKKRLETLEKELKAAQDERGTARDALKAKEGEMEDLREQQRAAAESRRRAEASRTAHLVSVGKRQRAAQALGKWHHSAQKAQIQATQGEIKALRAQLEEAQERSRRAAAAAKSAALPQLRAAEQKKSEREAAQAEQDRVRLQQELGKLKGELAAAKKQVEKGPSGGPGGLRVVPTSMSTPKQVVITLRVDGGKVTGYVNDREMGNTAAETTSGLHPALHGLSPQGSDKPVDESAPAPGVPLPVAGVPQPAAGQGGGCAALCQRGGNPLEWAKETEQWEMLLNEQTGPLWDAGEAKYEADLVAAQQKKEAAQRKYPQFGESTIGTPTPKAAPPKPPRTGAGPAPRVASLYGMS